MRADLVAGRCNRRAFLLTTVAGVLSSRLSRAQPAVTRPVVSEKACPLETITPVAADGHRGLAVLRKPPGPGRFPSSSGFTVALPLCRVTASKAVPAISPPARGSKAR
jgi:hypothetical protein